MYFPSGKEFLNLTKQGNLIPVYREILGDLETPVSAYLKIARRAKYSFLLESVEGEEKVARFSFLAKDPEVIIQSKKDFVKIIRYTGGKMREDVSNVKDTPLSFIREILGEYQFVTLPPPAGSLSAEGSLSAGLPRFCGGLVGYLSYDIARFFEKLPQTTKDDLKLPDMYLILAKDLLIFDHLNHKIKVISCAHVDSNSSRQQKLNAYRKSIAKIDGLVRELGKPLAAKEPSRKSRATAAPKIKSNFTTSGFMGIVQEAKKKIQEGDIIQVVLSQRFEVDLKAEPFNIYRMLRALNPSPYMYYIHFDDVRLVGSSPEMLIRCEEGVVETRPIAGTRPRGKDEQEDIMLAKDLLDDPKEKAEHIMLVDLGRNDLGRVCERGSVRICEFMKIEKYSHVMHIVSSVQGKLRTDRDGLDVLQAAFPAGTVSGAPKIRAMAIIDELEKVHRGPYAGCIGYFSFSGNLDSCITIRTIVVKGKKAYVQAGAGIVADSVGEKEYQETVNKATAQLRAIELAAQC